MQCFSCQQRNRDTTDSSIRVNTSRDELQITVSSATGLLDLVSATVEDIDTGNHSAAQKKLVAIKKGSRSVIKQCEYRRQRLSELENTKKREEEELQDEIGQLESSIQETEKSLARLKARKCRMQEELAEENRNLVEAQKKHAEAQESLESRETGATAGTWATVALGVVMPLTLAATVPTLMYLKGLVKDAKNNVDSAELKVQDTKASISSLKHNISSQKDSIYKHRQSMSKLDSDHQVVIRQRGDLRRTIVFIQRATTFFNLLIVATEAGGQRTNLLHSIVSKLREKQEFFINSSRGVQRVAQTFRDAWNEVEQLADSGEEFLSIKFSDNYMKSLSTVG